MLVHRFLETNATSYPDKDALINLGARLTYAQLDEKANKLANSLISNGVAPGDRVGILVESSLDYVISFFGVLKAGCVVVGLNTDTTSRILKSVLSDCSASAIIVRHNLIHHLTGIIGDLHNLKLVIADGEYDKLENERQLAIARYPQILESDKTKNPAVPRNSDDLATIMYTSGTTGDPKGVMLTHHNLEANTESIVEYLGLTPDDKVMDILPLYYSYGLSLLLTHIKVGGALVIDTRFTFPNVILESMSKEKVTGFAGVPTTFAILMNRSNFKKYSWDHLRYLTQAGGPMAPALTSKLIEAVPNVKLFVMYGQTEASARLSYLEPDKVISKLGSIGKAIPGVTLTVRDEDGNACPAGVVGEIVAQGENIMKGYWNRPDETQKVLKGDGLHTGDLARCDEDGYFFIVGRNSEMIKSGAHRISPKEIEEIILEHEAVAETAVVGRRDPILGEAICAVIVLKDGHTASDKDILVHCTKNLPAFKVPKYVQFAESLPKTQSGKVQRVRIKDSING
jgi:acyl-CoA synthetase (AMP-forming)/AMP-acid ligase II